MEDSDETLATVTYLPGVRPPEAGATAESPTKPEALDDHQEVLSSDGAYEEDEADGEVADDLVDQDDRVAQDDWAVQERRAENVSMHALTRRGLSRAELGAVLLARELDECVVESELDRLERVGLIDDDALAETIVRTQRERKGLGKAALTAELRRRRLDPAAIEFAIEQLDEEGDRRQALELAERRARQFRGLDRETAIRRLGGYLQRKGYSPEIVRSAVVAALPRQESTVRFR